MSVSSRRGTLAAVLLVAALGGFEARAFPAEFEKPSAIVPNVAFWKKVYAEWKVDDIALHDEEDLGMIYRVVRVPKRGATDAQGRTRPQTINAARAELEVALRALQKKQPKDASSLTGLEREVFTAIASSGRPDKYTRLSKIRAQNGLAERFIQGYQNSGLYEEFITRELTKAGLPKELIGVAFVESLFTVSARSHVGAAGVWQFMSYTGREYMELNAVVDERWDPILATEAAAKYLKQAKKELVTWPLAVTSYNYGRGGMRGLAKGAGTNDFNVILAVSKGKRFGFAARNYYASFLAVLEILDEAPRRFASIPKRQTWAYDVIRLPFSAFSTQLVGTGLVDQATLEHLNPALSTSAARGALPLPHGMSVRVPRGQGAAVVRALNDLPERERQRALRSAKAVVVASAPTSLKELSKKHGVSAEFIAARNGIDKDAVVAKGTRVVIPPPQVKTSVLPEARATPMPPMTVSAPPVLVADAAELLPEEGPAPKKLQLRPLAPAALTGVVRVRAIRSEALPEPLPAVDVLAGAVPVLPTADVLVGEASEADPVPTTAATSVGGPGES